MTIREHVKWILFPGLNLHARLRGTLIPKYLGRPQPGTERLVLDAGCGNGLLAYRACQLGNRVIGVSIKDEVQRNRQLFNEGLKIPESRLSFRELNLYNVRELGENQFDEIICTEVLEHIRGDLEVCRSFYDLLKPGGTLHLCCPNADHAFHKAYPLDPHERGGHVRPGYTYDSYRALLEPLGFQVSPPIGVGGPLRHTCNESITRAQGRGGIGLGFLAFIALAPWSVFDSNTPPTPFSLYVRASKPRPDSIGNAAGHRAQSDLALGAQP